MSACCPKRAPAKNLGFIYCRMLGFVQQLLFNSQLDGLLEEYLPGIVEQRKVDG